MLFLRGRSYNSVWRMAPAALIPAALQYVLVLLYGCAGWSAGIASVLFFSGTVSLGAHFYRYVPATATFPYIRAVYAAAVLFAAFDLALVVYWLSDAGLAGFRADFMLYAVTGAYQWLVLSRTPADISDECDTQEIVPAPAPDPESSETNRFTVKKGSRIHIIERDDILYIAAMGDYVSIVTAEGRFIKEGTMAYYESALGNGFARIHRSTIVSIKKISSIERYGKHTYNIKITSGESLRASAAGYRMLREKLGY